MTDTSPTTENRTLPKRLPNSAYRVREYLTEKEEDRLIETARKRGRNGARDAAAILLAYRHGANPRAPTLFPARKGTRFGRAIARSERPGGVEEPGLGRRSL